MKLKFSYIAYTVIAIALVVGVSRVYALTGPRSTSPSQSEISTPVNNSGEVQIKKGSVVSKGDLGATSGCSTIPLYAWFDLFPENSNQDIATFLDNKASPCIQGGALIASGFLVSPWGFFTQVISSSVIVGSSSAQSGDLPSVSEPVSADPTSMKLDLIGRGTGNNSIEGTQAIKINTSTGNMCNTYATVTVNQDQIGFNSSVNGAGADILARQVRLTGGNPRANSVLIGTPTNSGPRNIVSSWATLTVENDQIVLTPN